MTEPNFEGIGFTSRRTRDRLIGRLEASGIRNPAVLEVMRQVPRHIFIDEALAHRAYEDSSLPIGHGQTISQPYIVARMTELLVAQGRLQRVLEVGSGCGYQTAVLSQLADRVWTVERIGPLLTKARRHWSQLKLRNITARLGDGFEGWADRGPFDGILLAAAPRQVPPALLEQLAPGGVLVAPVGDRDEQVLERHWREGSVLKSEVLEAVRFVPMLGGNRLMGFWGVALRGYAMGAAELVPGVSGGTIAFISGLYGPLLASLAAFDGSFLQLLRRGDLRGAFVHVHGRFLLTLVLGMGLAILSLAALLKFLLATQAMLLWAFFFGLILASAVHVALSVGRWGALEGAAATLGVISGAWLTVLGGSFSFTDGPLALFFGGALAVCAWILPGVSGSFLLLVLGLYDRVLGAIAGVVIPDLLALAAGCGLGLLLFVRLLQRLLLTARKATLAALGGFMFGALQMLWPWQRVEAYQLGRDGAMRVLRSEPLGPNAYAQFYGEDPQLWAVAGLMCLGVAVVWGLARGQGYGDA